VGPLLKRGEEAVLSHALGTIGATAFAGRAKGRPLYLVGGSWRSLARLDMIRKGYPLPITHFYRMKAERPKTLQKAANEAPRSRELEEAGISASRLATLPQANLVLRAAIELLQPAELIVSAFGIREGLLYRDLDAGTRALYPLIEGAREAGRGLSRFGGHGDILDRWIGGIFEDEAHCARLRLAACLLADIAWQTHPDFRAERGIDMALHGNWVGLDGPGRVMIAQALFCNFGGGGRFDDLPVAGLCTRKELDRASNWGLAMRLGQRMSGGVAESLGRSRIGIEGETLRLELKRKDAALYGEAVDRRLKTLASALGRPFELVLA
jgi:exopolyphosphatase/guanosine-5'-triphosphate,3'-diphosphate pyrophosphatase